MATDTGAILPGDDDWPEGQLCRWTAQRKEEVLRRLDEGEMRLNEAFRRYHLTVEEIDAWTRAHHKYGRRGLRLGLHRAAVPPASPEQGKLL